MVRMGCLGSLNRHHMGRQTCYNSFGMHVCSLHNSQISFGRPLMGRFGVP